jgi:hypothetical protein
MRFELKPRLLRLPRLRNLPAATNEVAAAPLLGVVTLATSLEVTSSRTATRLVWTICAV